MRTTEMLLMPVSEVHDDLRGRPVGMRTTEMLLMPVSEVHDDLRPVGTRTIFAAGR